MSLRAEIPELINFVKSKKKYLAENKDLYQAYSGGLCELVEQQMQRSMSESTYQSAKGRIPPINILQKLVDKLSTIYQQSPARELENGSPSDSELLMWYEENFRMNKMMNLSNEFLAMSKTALAMPFVHKGLPRLRTLHQSKFLVYSNDPIDPTYMTHLITFQGECLDMSGEMTGKLHVWTDSEFVICNMKNEILIDEMIALGNPEGINPYGKIPAVYINSSDDQLIPDLDSDILRMTLLIPQVLADLNVGSMFTVWPLLWTKDVKLQNLEYSPSSYLAMHSDPTNEKAVPEIGFLKPEMDIPQHLELIKSELGFWLNTKNIRPGAVGELNGDNFSSGISKMIDEGDTFEERKKAVEIYKVAEKQLWDLIINYTHPVWVKRGLIATNALFTPGLTVKTSFPVQVPLVSRGTIVRDLKDEVDAGFTTVEVAVKRLNPEMTEAEILELISEIESANEQSVQVTVAPQVVSADNPEENPQDQSA